MKSNLVYAAFGSELVEAIETQDIDKIKYLSDTPNAVVKRKFETEAEAQAYRQGLIDSFGWMESVCIDGDNDFEQQLINHFETKLYF